MKGYIVVNSTLKNSEKMKQYISADKYLGKYNGEVITVGSIEVLSGTNSYESMLIIEFRDNESAKLWFNSPEYKKLKNEVLDLAVDSTFTRCKSI